MNLVDTATFKKWFGDSKVVDAEGRPLVVYHGSPSQSKWNAEERRYIPTSIIRSFEFKESGRSGFLGSTRAVKSPSIFFSESAYIARAFGANRSDRPDDVTLYKVYLKIEHPLNLLGNKNESSRILKKIGVISDWGKREMWEVLDDPESVRLIRGAGFDGAVVSEMSAAKTFDMHKSPYYGDTWAVFSPTQIKSATGNDGSFDADDSDIRSNPSGARDIETYDKARALVDKLLTWLDDHNEKETRRKVAKELVTCWGVPLEKGLFVLFAEEMGGRKGLYGTLDGDGNKRIVIYMLDNMWDFLVPNLIQKKIRQERDVKETLIHEITHWFDDLQRKTPRTIDAVPKSSLALKAGDRAGYFNDPNERNAYYTQGLHRLMAAWRDEEARETQYIGKSFTTWEPWALCQFTQNFIRHQNEDGMRRLHKRLYELYTHLKEGG